MSFCNFKSSVEFEWDENKNRSNELKHGINFSDAVNIFKDGKRVEKIDQRRNYGEIRYKITGVVEGRILVVVYTIRDGYCRIISARRARKNERKNYPSQII